MFFSGQLQDTLQKKMAKKKDRWAGRTRGKCGILSARRKIAAFDPHFDFFVPAAARDRRFAPVVAHLQKESGV